MTASILAPSCIHGFVVEVIFFQIWIIFLSNPKIELKVGRAETLRPKILQSLSVMTVFSSGRVLKLRNCQLKINRQRRPRQAKPFRSAAFYFCDLSSRFALPGAWSVSDSRKKLGSVPIGASKTNEHWVLQMLSLLTASSPNSATRCGQLLIFRDWHWAWMGSRKIYAIEL